MVSRYYLILILFHDILTQSGFSEDLIKLQMLNSCGESDYYDVALLQCIKCGNGVINQENYQKRSDDGLSCICKPGHRYTKYLGPPSNIECQPCPNGKVPSSDKWGCQKCDFDIATNSCKPCDKQYLEVERNIDGILQPSRTCLRCSADTEPNSSKGRCERCSYLTTEASGSGCECPKDQQVGGICFPKSKIISDNSNLYKVHFEKVKDLDSVYFRDNVRAAISTCKEYQNGTACQQLGNLCVLLNYNMDNIRKLLSPDACSEYQNILDQVPKKLLTNFPKLYFNDKAKSILERTSISQQFFFNKQSLSSQLRFKVAKFALNGEFLGLLDSEPEDFQLCMDKQERMATAFLFGTAYVQSCLINVQELLKKYKLIFYDLYLLIHDNEIPYLYPVPIRNEQLRKDGEFVNQDNDINKWVLTRRFFLVDNVIGKTTDKNKVLEGGSSILPKVLRYAEHLSIQVNLQKEDTGKIFPPYIHIRYAEVDKDDLENNKFVKVTFSVSYSMNIDKFLQDLSIAMGVMGALSVIWSIIKTWGWSKRAGRPEVDFFFLVKLIIYTGETLSNVILMTTYGACLWWFILYKRQDVVYLFLPTYDQEYFFRVYLGLALALKWVELIHMMIQHITVDIFFIDWERPRGSVAPTNLMHLEQKEPSLSVSIWRTYFIVNEWNEIQSIRRINPIFQVFCVLFFLKVLKFENWASLDPYGSSSSVEPDSSICRFVIAVSLYAGIGLIQWLFFVLFFERFIEDKIRQFVDTCSMSNISVFIMTHAQFGYYIHGRSVHGRADVDMKEMHEQLKKEEDDLVGQRGLVPNTDHQTFTICLPKGLRQHYNKVIQPITVLSHISSRFPGANLGGPTSIDRVVLAYHTINRFLSAFIDHSLKDLDYIVKDKQLIEGLLNVEFQDTSEKGIFYNDGNSNSFTNVLFYGNELTLLLFDILLFCIIDLISRSFILAGILTYFVGQLVLRIRDISGQKNLARKTLVDERFLI